VHPQFHPELFRDYIQHLGELANGAPLALDVKYFGINLIPTREDVDGSTPFLFRHMAQTKAKVVHVVRLNKLRIMISEEISKATGWWSLSRKEDRLPEKKALRLDPKSALAFIDAQLDQQRRTAEQLARVSDVETIKYETMFEGELFSEHTLEVARRVLKKAEVDPRPRNLRMNPEPISELVENFDELAEALRDTAHEWMLTAQ